MVASGQGGFVHHDITSGEVVIVAYGDSGKAQQFRFSRMVPFGHAIMAHVDRRVDEARAHERRLCRERRLDDREDFQCAVACVFLVHEIGRWANG